MFLFTDVEGSTRLWEQQPVAMPAALADHDRMLRDVIEAHRGHVFSTAGDAFSAAFWTPAEAVAAAVEGQRRLAGEPWPGGLVLRVRMGMHTGTADERDGNYFGSAVNRAARVMSAAHGGQVLLSLSTEELVRDRLPDGVGLVDLGEHVLTGLARRERLFQVCGRGLAPRFPPLRTPTHMPGNLPAAATSFVGHGEELQRLAADLPVRRLITLTGVGGVGKTRLAVEASWMVADEFPDGVWFCELAPVAEPAAVAHTVAATLSIRPQEGLSLVDGVVDALRGRRLMVILDNCEHVLEAAADLVAGITGSCPTVTVLATSREPLGVDGERVWAVPSLSAATDGVRLFCDRAEAADAAFSPSEHDVAVIAGICERLDGIPLAIELAAARVRFMTAADLAERLHDRFRVLRGGRRGLERHQTLRAAVQWSYGLLPEAERLLFDRLSVFAGSFTLSAAELICAGDGVDRLDIADHLAALVDKSMVVADRSGAHARYRLLETLRQFGEERLDETPQATELRDRHLAYYLSIVHQARVHYEGRAQTDGAATFRSEWDNIRAAVQWAVTKGDQRTATGLLDDLFFFSWLELRYELGDWASQALASRLGTPAVYGITALFAVMRGEHDHALRLAESGISAAKSRTEPETWLCWLAISAAHWYSGRVQAAWVANRTMAQTIDAARAPFAASLSAAMSAVSAATGAEPDSAVGLAAEAQRLAEPLANPALDAIVQWGVGAVERSAGHYAAARDHFIRALALAERSGNLYMQGVVPLAQAFLAVMMDAHDADHYLLDALRRVYGNRDWNDTWPAIEALALYWMRTGRLEDAAVLLGYLEAHRISHAMFVQQREHARRTLANMPQPDTWILQGAKLERDELVRWALRSQETSDHAEESLTKGNA